MILFARSAIYEPVFATATSVSIYKENAVRNPLNAKETTSNLHMIGFIDETFKLTDGLFFFSASNIEF